MTRRRLNLSRELWVCVGLFVGTVALFGRAMGYGFSVYDDPSYVSENAHVQAGLTWAGVAWAFTGAADYWHPLTWIDHMLDWMAFGNRAWGHHLTSVLWHAINAVMVFLLARRLSKRIWPSALFAAFFAWHPLRVESVVWITERKDVMSGFFFLATVWAYLVFAERRARCGPGAWRWYGGAFALFVAALMCKPIMVTLPGVLLLLDFWPLRRLTRETRMNAGGRTPDRHAAGSPASVVALVAEKVPFFVLSAVIAVVTLRMQQDAGAFVLEISMADRIANAVVSIPRYLGKFFWPFDLAVSYPHPGRWPALWISSAGLLVAAITIGAIAPWKRRPWLVVGWGTFLVMLLPAVGLVQAGFQAMADRYTYVPMLGVQMVLFFALAEVPWTDVTRRAGAAIAVLALLGCGWRTWNQEATWRDSFTMFTHAIEVVPNNYPAHAFLARMLLGEGRVGEAESHAVRAVDMKPDFAVAVDALALVHLKQGRLDEAVAGFQRALELAPAAVAARNDLGQLLLRRGQLDAAQIQFLRALKDQPDFAAPWAGLATIESIRQHTDAAIDDFRRGLALQPGNVDFRSDLAGLLASQRRFDEAEKQFREVIRLAPTLAEPHAALAGMYLEMDRGNEAMTEAKTAMTLGPVDPTVGVTLGDALAKSGNIAGAAGIFEMALKSRPDDVQLHVRLGYTLWYLKRHDSAVGHWETALRLQPDFPGLRERIDQAKRAMTGE